MARFSLAQGNPNDAETSWQENIRCCRAEEYQPGIALSLYWLADVNRTRGDLDRAWELFEESLHGFQSLDNKEYQAWCLYDLAVIMTLRGDYHQAGTLFEASLTQQRENGNKRGIAAACS